MRNVLQQKDNFVIGVDFGTDSVRAIVANTADGEVLATSVFEYPRWKEQLYCNPDKNQFRQHPLDYIEGLKATINTCVTELGPEAAAKIKALSLATTGPTTVPVDESGIPLSLYEEFADDPDGMFWLWKDHTSNKEAEEITEHSKKFSINYLKPVGGIYTAEWFWAKWLHVLRINLRIRNACYSWVEHCDWMPFLLSGKNHISELKRSHSAASFKALWNNSWNGWPPNEFFASLDPLLDGATKRLFNNLAAPHNVAGYLSKDWSINLGLDTNVLIGMGSFDCYTGAVGAQIQPYHLVKNMGTSSCDVLIVPKCDLKDKWVQGISGQSMDAIVPGTMGLLAGQSAFGDAYNWLKKILCWSLEHVLAASSLINDDYKRKLIEEVANKILPELALKAMEKPKTEKDELAVDWLNGRRSPDAEHDVKAAFVGLNLSTDAPSLFNALAEATCYGAKAIIDRFEEEGLPIISIIGAGGIAKKNPYIMQMLADVVNLPVRISKAQYTSALGAAMFAATASGIFTSIEEAMQFMGQGFETEYYPDKKRNEFYAKRYQKYRSLGEYLQGANF